MGTRTLGPARHARARRAHWRPSGGLESAWIRHRGKADDSCLQGVYDFVRSTLLVVVKQDGNERVSAPPNPLRLRAVHEHPRRGGATAAIIAGQPDISLVAECSNGREAIPDFRTHRPDV